MIKYSSRGNHNRLWIPESTFSVRFQIDFYQPDNKYIWIKRWLIWSNRVIVFPLPFRFQSRGIYFCANTNRRDGWHSITDFWVSCKTLAWSFFFFFFFLIDFFQLQYNTIQAAVFILFQTRKLEELKHFSFAFTWWSVILNPDLLGAKLNHYWTTNMNQFHSAAIGLSF